MCFLLLKRVIAKNKMLLLKINCVGVTSVVFIGEAGPSPTVDDNILAWCDTFTNGAWLYDVDS